MNKKSFKGTGAELFLSPQTEEAPEQSKQQTGTIISDNITENESDTIKPNATTNTLYNILEHIRNDEPKGANHTFYLSAETAAAIAATAKEKKISRSKLVDAVLKQVLLGGA